MPADQQTIQQRISVVTGGCLAAAGLFVLGLIIWGVATAPYDQLESEQSSYSTIGSQSSPNAVTSGFAAAGGQLSQTGGRSVGLMKIAVQGVGDSAADVGTAIGNAASATGSMIGRGASTVVGGLADGLIATFKLPGKAVSAIVDAPALGSVIRPHDHEHEAVPIIDPDSPELAAAIKAINSQQSAPAASAGISPAGQTQPRWPLRGAVTTEFGERGWPYNPTHTGIDISDGTRPGTTDVRPFQPGRVIHVEQKGSGLGNHVIVDHGNGITSVYAHLASITVQNGQQVDHNTVVGKEGTTGLSTGTHLHFEIRVNGMAANPRQFIPGNPS